MFGIYTGRVRYVPSHDKILIVLGLVRQEFRRESEVPMVGSSDVSRLTDSEIHCPGHTGHVWYRRPEANG